VAQILSFVLKGYLKLKFSIDIMWPNLLVKQLCHSLKQLIGVMEERTKLPYKEITVMLNGMMQ
jgi:hypothetical protein